MNLKIVYGFQHVFKVIAFEKLTKIIHHFTLLPSSFMPTYFGVAIDYKGYKFSIILKRPLTLCFILQGLFKMAEETHFKTSLKTSFQICHNIPMHKNKRS